MKSLDINLLSARLSFESTITRRRSLWSYAARSSTGSACYLATQVTEWALRILTLPRRPFEKTELKVD